MNRIIAVDFDGTCVTYEYPRVEADFRTPSKSKCLNQPGVKIIVWMSLFA